MPLTNAQEKLKPLAVFVFLIASLFYGYEFFIQVSPAVMSQSLTLAFHTNATQLGIIASAFYYAYTLMQIPSGLLLDRFGARIILTLVTLGCAIGALLFGLSTTILAASLSRFLMGVCSAFAFVSVLYIIIRWIPAKKVALFIGFIQVIGSIGSIVGTTPLAALTLRIGWRNTMHLLFIIGLLLSIAIWFFVKDRPATLIEPKAEKTPILPHLKTIFKNRQTWYIALYSFAVWAPMTAFAALWGEPFLTLLGKFTPLQAATSIAWIWIGAAIASPLIGLWSDHINRRNLPLMLMAFIGFLAASIVIFIPDLSLYTTQFLLFLIGVAASGQSLAFAVVRDSNSLKTVNAANGLNNMIVVSSGAILQPLMGKILDMNWHGTLLSGVRIYDLHAYQIALSILPIFLLLAFILSAVFLKETHCKSCD